MRIEHLYRYPVKGLTAEALEAAPLTEGHALPWDRAFALAQGDAPFNPSAPGWLMKTNFMCLMADAKVAALRSSFEPATGMLTIRHPDGDRVAANALTVAGRAVLGTWLSAFLGEDARGTPHFHHVPGHVFCDQKRPGVSLINLASLADLERHAGARRDRMRFRANIYFTGTEALSELDWVGRELQVGTARLRVVRRTVRCPATQVNPETAQRDADPQRELRDAYGHADLGVHAVVVEPGTIALGDAIELLPG